MTTATDVLQEIKLTQLREAGRNPRKHYDAKKLEELTASVKQSGVRVPLVVRPLPPSFWPSPTEPRFEIGAGHRRYRAAKKAGLESVRAFVEEMDDDAFQELLSFENLNREDLHPLDEAQGFNDLLALKGGAKWDVQAIADKIGLSTSYVYTSLRLLKLVKPVREAFLADEITAGHATDISRLAPDDQLQALKAAVGKGERSQQYPMSVRELRSFIQRDIIRDLSKAPFDVKSAELVPAAGACGPCPKRAANNPELFGEIAKGDRCMDGSCFTGKVQAWLEGIRTKAKADGHKVVDIRADYYGGPGHVKGLEREKWQDAGAKECDSFALGVVVDGNYQQAQGSILKVCLKPGNCKVHNARAVASRSSSSSRSAAARPLGVPLEYRVDDKVFELLRHKIKTPLVQPDLVIVVANLLRDVDGELITKAYDWKRGDLRDSKTSAARLAKLSQKDLGRLLVEAVVAREIEDGLDKPVMEALSRRYGIDRKKVEAELKAEDAAKAKAKGKPAPSGSAAKKKSVTKKGKKT